MNINISETENFIVYSNKYGKFEYRKTPYLINNKKYLSLVGVEINEEFRGKSNSTKFLNSSIKKALQSEYSGIIVNELFIYEIPKQILEHHLNKNRCVKKKVGFNFCYFFEKPF